MAFNKKRAASGSLPAVIQDVLSPAALGNEEREYVSREAG